MFSLKPCHGPLQPVVRRRQSRPCSTSKVMKSPRPGCVHHLVCIGQEAVSNAIRHAQASRIVIHLKYESDALSLCIRDDGRGFHASDRSSSRRGHFGIPVMEERARKLGGTLRLQTSAGTGTEVTVRVSFNAMLQPVNQEHHVIRWIGI